MKTFSDGLNSITTCMSKTLYTHFLLNLAYFKIIKVSRQTALQNACCYIIF